MDVEYKTKRRAGLINTRIGRLVSRVCSSPVGAKVATIQPGRRWRVSGSYLGRIWVVSGSYLGRIWVVSGSYLGPLLSGRHRAPDFFCTIWIFHPCTMPRLQRLSAVSSTGFAQIVAEGILSRVIQAISVGKEWRIAIAVVERRLTGLSGP